jgi:hypothetical protein
MHDDAGNNRREVAMMIAKSTIVTVGEAEAYLLMARDNEMIVRTSIELGCALGIDPGSIITRPTADIQSGAA